MQQWEWHLKAMEEKTNIYMEKEVWYLFFWKLEAASLE